MHRELRRWVEDLIEVNAAVPLHKSLEGSAVIDATTGELLGLLVSLNNRWVISP